MSPQIFSGENRLVNHYNNGGLPMVLKIIIAELEKIEGLVFTAENSLKGADAHNEQQVMNVAGNKTFELRMQAEKLQADLGGES